MVLVLAVLAVKQLEPSEHLLEVSAPVVPAGLIETSTLNVESEARRGQQGWVDLVEYDKKGRSSLGVFGGAQFISLNAYNEYTTACERRRGYLIAHVVEDVRIEHVGLMHGGHDAVLRLIAPCCEVLV
jgi:hypothetical protein